MNNKEKKTHSMKARGMISDVIVHVVLALLAIVWVIPVLWIALLSFSTQKGSYVTSFFPKGYTLHNCVRLFTDTDRKSTRLNSSHPSSSRMPSSA